jgi:CRISPR-associated endonuclease/helicase Cas3
MPVSEFLAWFKGVTGNPPHPWQARLAAADSCQDRLIRIPTGFGKTAGTVLAWLYHRVVFADISWPTRLVFCLPMRTLVEQTESAIRGWLEKSDLAGHVGLYVLMGGSDAGPWRLKPEGPAILVGTQDMLLSRALNRGYGAGRAAWPMEFGLLHHDVLWVSDEIQLQDVGLATSTQLAAFRAQDAESRCGALRPSRTWWMSATLQARWLETVDHASRVHALQGAEVRIPTAERSGGLWAVKKSIGREALTGEVSADRGSQSAKASRRKTESDWRAAPAKIASSVVGRHKPGTLTLVVVNTVDRAIEVFESLEAAYSTEETTGKTRKRRVALASAPDLRLVHSRFRGAERRDWAAAFLRRGASLPEAGRIIVATQVIEAGVDISARLLVTDLAPWPSLVQRFGRVARYEGETGEICVVGGGPHGESSALPYGLEELQASSAALDRLIGEQEDAAPSSLDEFEEVLGATPGELERLYPFAPRHVLRRTDIDQLFDTTPDLSGADLDVSRYIRSGDERDVQVFWRGLDSEKATVPMKDISRVARDELCPVAIGKLKEWLKRRKILAYRFDYLDGVWLKLDAERLIPGQQLLVSSKSGGYEVNRGFSPGSADEVAAPQSRAARDLGDESLESASESEDEDALSMLAESAWKTIEVHGREAGQHARRIAEALSLDGGLADILDLAGRWHDAGKAHRVFQSAIKDSDRELAKPAGLRKDLAKAPESAWRRPAYPERPGFRHELASTLALFELLRRVAPRHEALLGRHLDLLESLGEAPTPLADELRVAEDHPLAREIAALDAESFDLLVWLVCTHHGKVRCMWTSTPHDQVKEHGGIHGVCEGDSLPSFDLASRKGSGTLPVLGLSLAAAEMGLGPKYGASWGERVAGLVRRHGPFRLAYLEALLRAADVRASIEGSPTQGKVRA